jgi:enoyl-CoA hydratase/carnithine racemase
VAHASARHRAVASKEAAARLARLRVQPEAQEGFSAFFAKRKPSWRPD